MNYKGMYNNLYGMLGADIDLNDKNSLSLSIGNGFVYMKTENAERESNYSTLPPENKVTVLKSDMKPITPEVNLIFDHIFDSADHKFTLMAHYSLWDGNHLHTVSKYSTGTEYDINNLVADTSIYVDDLIPVITIRYEVTIKGP